MRRAVSMPSRGFTLLEVMIVIVIILLILGLIGVNLMGTKRSADVKLVQAQLQTFRQALDQFYLEFNRYPAEEEGLAVLWKSDNLPEEDKGRWRSFLREPVPKDPWGSEWGYTLTPAEEGQEESVDVWSYGPDKQPETSDDVRIPRRGGDDAEDSGIAGPQPRTGG